MANLDTVFTILLFLGIGCGLVALIASLFLLSKRFAQGATEVEFLGFGKLKTTESAVALGFLGVFLFVYSVSSYGRNKNSHELQTRLDTVMLKTARDLSTEYHWVTDRHQRPINPNDFSRASLLIGVLQQLDTTNGHALYFSGEINRSEGFPDPDQASFLRYLDIYDSLSRGEKSNDSGDSEVCYNRPNGYCRQRSGWVHYLLANDFNDKAGQEKDPRRELFWLQKALEQTQASRREFPSGFIQRTPTRVLELELPAKIEELKKTIAQTP